MVDGAQRIDGDTSERIKPDNVNIAQTGLIFEIHQQFPKLLLVFWIEQNGFAVMTTIYGVVKCPRMGNPRSTHEFVIL